MARISFGMFRLSANGSAKCSGRSARVRIMKRILAAACVRSAGRNQSMLSIRPARASDVPALNTLIHEFAEFERLPVAATEASLLRDGFGEAPKFRVLMAEWDGQACRLCAFLRLLLQLRGSSRTLSGGHLRARRISRQGNWQGAAGPSGVGGARKELLWRALAGARLEYSGDRVLQETWARLFWTTGKL